MRVALRQPSSRMLGVSLSLWTSLISLSPRFQAATTHLNSPLSFAAPVMTTPLKALIQERLRAKIGRQEVEGDDMDELVAMGHEHQHHGHHHQSHHEHRYSELQSPSRLQRGTGNAQRTRHQQQRQQSTQEASQYRVRDSSAAADQHHHHHKRHKSSTTHNQQQQQEQEQQSQYTTNQKLIDYYTYEHHQKHDNYFPQDHNFGHGNHAEHFKTLTYEDDRSPLLSPWRGPSAGNQFQDEDQEDVGEVEESKIVESPRHAPPPPPQQHHQRASSAELHPRDRDSRVEAHGSFRTVEPSCSSFASDAKRELQHHHQKAEQPQPHDGYESVYNVIAKSTNNNQSQERQHAYPRGHFESQLYDDEVPDTKHEESTQRHRHHRHRQHHHPHHKHHPTGNLELESPQVTRIRDVGTFDAPYDVDNTSYELGQYECTLNNNNNSSEHSTQSELGYHQQQRHHHHNYSHEQRFGQDDMVRSPLAAATSLAPLVFAAVTSPRLETKRSFFPQPRKREHNHNSTGSASASTAPAPLDMAVIEATRRRDDIDAMPAIGSNIHRRSTSTLVRCLDAMLSPGCHRAATVSNTQ